MFHMMSNSDQLNLRNKTMSLSLNEIDTILNTKYVHMQFQLQHHIQFNHNLTSCEKSKYIKVPLCFKTKI